MNVSFIGSGNLAWHLAPALDNTEFAVKEVYSRNITNASSLVERLYDAQATSSLDFSESKSRIFIISVIDHAISEIVEEITLPEGAILLHTSGSQPLSLLTYATPHNGVFYPLQTFTKTQKISFQDIPILIESEDIQTEKIVVAMAKAISKKVYKISSDKRKVLHIAAVFASNFTNHILTLSKEILQQQKLDFDLLRPLIVETINKSLAVGPEKGQTGPAKRGDLEILDRHMEFLQYDKDIAEIYRVISQHIVDRYVEE